MKKLIIVFVIFCSVLSAQDDINVMSYYASDNSLDGQPRIDMTNILRFFPVYAILEDVTEVYVIIYYGSEIYESYADKMSGGDYWQTLLPDFKLGDALQRVEIEMKFNLEKIHSEQIKPILDTISSTANTLKNIKPKFEKAQQIEDKIKSELTSYNFSVFRKVIYNIGNTKESFIDKTYDDSTAIINNSKEFLENFPATKDITGSEFERLNKRIEYLKYIATLINNSQKINRDLDFIANQISTIFMYVETQKELSEKLQELELIKLKKQKDLHNQIVGELADSSFSGPAIRKSDLVISDDFKSAKLLYRYYKTNLRYRKALDPAESLGIFRARYVPLPVVGTPGDNKVQLLRPMEANVPVVFEVGLAFGDEVVSGDNTFEPALSLSRLGVAIVITEKLFKADAEILGIAFTYDFNSYASIGFGRNLAQGQSYPYFSFGINKKAFEQLLAGLAGLFN